MNPLFYRQICVLIFVIGVAAIRWDVSCRWQRRRHLCSTDCSEHDGFRAALPKLEACVSSAFLYKGSSYYSKAQAIRRTVVVYYIQRQKIMDEQERRFPFRLWPLTAHSSQKNPPETVSELGKPYSFGTQTTSQDCITTTK